MKTLITNGKILLPSDRTEHCDILIENGRIVQMGEKIEVSADKVIDAEGNMVFPGFVDVHVHLREPGGEEKETILTGTKAAARGGFTLVCTMPNTNPVPDNEETVQELFAKIEEKATVRVLPYASITKGLQGEELTDMDTLSRMGVFAFTDDGVGVQRTDQMLEAMKRAAKNNKSIVAHCEDNTVVGGGVVHDGEVKERLQLPGIPSISESVQIARDVLLAESAGCHYHVCHVSTKESVRVIRDAKRAGIRVTAEVTPHHLLLNEEDIPNDDANYKMNPPLRSKEDQEALLEGLLDGTIDFIATDHAPHTEREKEKGMLKAPFGIVGLETAFPLLYTCFVKKNIFSLNQLVNWLTAKPCEVFRLPYGKLTIGEKADLTIIDLEKEWVIEKEKFLSKGKNTPFDRWNVSGSVMLTMVDGEVVYKQENSGILSN